MRYALSKTPSSASLPPPARAKKESARECFLSDTDLLKTPGNSSPGNLQCFSSCTEDYSSYEEELWLGMLTNFVDPDATLLRFLRARRWDLDAATEMLYNTVKWRCDFGVLSLMKKGESAIPGHLLSSGKTFFHKTDNSNHLVM